MSFADARPQSVMVRVLGCRELKQCQDTLPPRPFEEVGRLLLRQPKAVLAATNGSAVSRKLCCVCCAGSDQSANRDRARGAAPRHFPR
eukprot:3062722-Rhodomonas_salina.1